ncbi:Aminopeptidase M1-D, partial [Taenia solium]
SHGDLHHCHDIGDFEYISTTVPNTITSNVCSAISLPKRIEIRVYASLGKRNFGQHALAVAKKSLAFYIELFQCPYALPKLHLVAIPDFDCSAMENWGLMTFRTAVGGDSCTNNETRLFIVLAGQETSVLN